MKPGDNLSMQEATLERALRLLRQGEFGLGWKHLQDELAQGLLPNPGSGPATELPDVVELRVASLLGECHDYYGRYEEAAAVLAPWESQIHAGLASGAGSEKIRRSDDEAGWKYRRQILYVAHQMAATDYRRQDFDRARARIEHCLRFATELLEPVPHSVIKRLLFAQGKLALRERQPETAIKAFRSALLRAEAGYSLKRDRLFQDINRAGKHGDAAEVVDRLQSQLHEEERIFGSWAGQVFALGLGQAYLVLGNVDEARSMIIGGLLLLNPSDELHAAYARMVLAKAERLSAGREARQQLEEAGRRLAECRKVFATYFGRRLSHLDLRAWHEASLNAAALGRFAEARSSLRKLLERVEKPGELVAGRARWIVLGRLGLSEIALRAKDYAEAMTQASEARRIAQRECQYALQEEAELAEHDAAACAALKEVDGAPSLTVAAENLERLLRRLSDSPLRALPALRLTQVRLKLGDPVGARAAMAEFRSCEQQVSVTMVRELADEVAEALTQFRALRLPVDETGEMELDVNLKAFIEHLLTALPSKRGSEPWKELGVPKSTFYEIKRAVAQGKVTLRASAPRRGKDLDE